MDTTPGGRTRMMMIESEANQSFGGNVYYVTMQITLPIPKCTRNERNFHCDVLHIAPDRVVTLVLDDAIAAIQTSNPTNVGFLIMLSVRRIMNH